MIYARCGPSSVVCSCAMPAYFTVGHSTRSVSELVALLQNAGVKLLADVRAIPRSRTNPQFNIEALPPELAANGMGYEHFPELGGRRGRARADSPNEFWEHARFRNYADYLIAAGDTVFHILAAGKIEPAKLTPAARRTPEGTLVYPR